MINYNLFQFIPKELKNIIFEYIPNHTKALITKKYYNTFFIDRQSYLKKTVWGNHLGLHKKFNFDTYIRYILKKDYDYLFHLLLKQHHNRWHKLKKFNYKKKYYKTYACYITEYCIENKKLKCLRILKEFQRKKCIKIKNTIYYYGNN